MDATFDENFTSPLSMPNLPYQRSIKKQNTKLGNTNSEPLLEKTGGPTGKETSFPDISGLPQQNADSLVDYPKDQDYIAFTSIEEGRIPVKQKEMITAYFSSIEKFSDSSLQHSEFLYIAHELSSTNKVLDNSTDEDINLSDCMPEPKSLSQILRLSPAMKEKWESAISVEMQGLFENDTFDPNERPLPADEMLPVKLALKTRRNSYGGLDKLKIGRAHV